MEAILDKLFESTAKARLMKLFLMNPEREFIMPEIVKQTQLKKPAIQKELAKLLKLGLVKMRTARAAVGSRGKQKLVKVAKENKGKRRVAGATRKAKSVNMAKVVQVKKSINAQVAKKPMPAKIRVLKTAKIAAIAKIRKVAKAKTKKQKSKKR